MPRPHFFWVARKLAPTKVGAGHQNYPFQNNWYNTATMTSHAAQCDLYLSEALQYMKEHPEAKISQVAREFNINRNTLKARFNGGTSRAGFPA